VCSSPSPSPSPSPLFGFWTCVYIHTGAMAHGSASDLINSASSASATWKTGTAPLPSLRWAPAPWSHAR
jgi:hypothetical protein